MHIKRIHHVLKDISDLGSIYVGRNPTFAGNIIRHNFFHHLFLQHRGGPGVQAIFLDDDTLYVARIFGNVFYKTGSTGVIKFHGGGGASIANNIAIRSPQLVQDGPGDVEGIRRAISKMHTDQPHGNGFPQNGVLPLIEQGKVRRVFSSGHDGIFRAHEPLLPNGKADVNDTPHAAVRLSMPDINDAYPAGDAATRRRIYDEHLYYNLGH